MASREAIYLLLKLLRSESLDHGLENYALLPNTVSVLCFLLSLPSDLYPLTSASVSEIYTPEIYLRVQDIQHSKGSRSTLIIGHPRDSYPCE